MRNNNLLERPIQFLISLELHSEKNKNIQREVTETDQNKDEIKDEDDHQQVDKKEDDQMDEKKNGNTKNKERNVKSRRNAKQRAISNIQKYMKEFRKNNYDFLDTPY